MKKIINTLIFSALVSLATLAQTTKNYKVPFSGADKRVQIFSGANILLVQSYNGTDVVIEAEAPTRDLPEEAQGLRIISAGASDNTGVGANVETEGNVLKIRIPKSKYFGNFLVKIPKGLSLSLKESGNAYGKWIITGIDGEVEATTSYSTLTIKDVSGPIVARGGYGKISVIFDKLNPTKPNSISASGSVDVSMPADSKTSVKLKSSYGDVFTDFELATVKTDEKTKSTESSKIKPASGQSIADLAADLTKDDNDDNDNSTRPAANRSTNASGFTVLSTNKNVRVPPVPPKLGNTSSWAAAYADDSDDDCNCKDGVVTGNINGGGVSLSLKSDHGNIYLRKRKQ